MDIRVAAHYGGRRSPVKRLNPPPGRAERGSQPPWRAAHPCQATTFALLTPSGRPFSIGEGSRCRRGSAAEGGRSYGRDEGSRGARGFDAVGRCGEPHAPLHAIRRGLVEAAGHSLGRGVLRNGRSGPQLHRRAGGALHDASRARQGPAPPGPPPADEGAPLLSPLELSTPP